MENAPAVVEHNVVNFEEFAMTGETIKKQVAIIQDVMSSVMSDGEHYGVIPGCGKKPTLLKPGAEKLSTTFRLAPSYAISRYDLPKGHREYEVMCTLTHIPSGQVIGQGVGSCSTMEGRYRFRTGEVESTGNPVPKAYWNGRDQNLIGGKGYSVKKINGNWEIVRAGEKVEHDNPADYYNTVLKMAKKRAHVDAILTATAASDIFTQDIEDMKDVLEPKAESPKSEQKKAAPKASKKQTKKSQPKSKKNEEPDPFENGDEPPANATQKGKLKYEGQQRELSPKDVEKLWNWYKRGESLTRKEADELLDNFDLAIENYNVDQAA